MTPKVVNVKYESCDIYIGRKRNGYHWGNPFIIGKDGDRDGVITKFEEWFLGIDHRNIELDRKEWMWKNISILRGKKLGCFCSPLSCHREILLREANR